MSHDPRATRVLDLYRSFLRGGKGSTAELANRHYGGDKRTALRDLQLLEQHSELRSRGEGQERVWELPSEVLPQALGLQDAIALLFGKESTAFLGPVGLSGVFDRLAIDRAVHIRHRQRLADKFICLQEPARHYEPAQSALLEPLMLALIEERSLELEYRRGQGVEVEQLAGLQPLSLALYRRAIYLLARPAGQKAHRTFALERILSLRLGPPAPYPEDWRPAEALAGPFGLWSDGQSEHVRLRFSASRAHLVRCRRWHRSQKIVERPDGDIELQLYTRGRELVRFCLEWGPHCEVLEPAWLREAVTAELRAALQRYQG
jgi:predicted DNA-binding transcriptional regulator YafY